MSFKFNISYKIFVYITIYHKNSSTAVRCVALFGNGDTSGNEPAMPAKIIRSVTMYMPSFKTLLAILIGLSLAATLPAQKQVYIPKFISNTGMDLNKSSSQWCYARSGETDNIVVFWESGFGADPSTASGNYRVDLNALLGVAEKSYSVYVDSLKFAIKGSSVADKYNLN